MSLCWWQLVRVIFLKIADVLCHPTTEHTKLPYALFRKYDAIIAACVLQQQPPVVSQHKYIVVFCKIHTKFWWLHKTWTSSSSQKHSTNFSPLTRSKYKIWALLPPDFCASSWTRTFVPWRFPSLFSINEKTGFSCKVNYDVYVVSLFVVWRPFICPNGKSMCK